MDSTPTDTVSSPEDTAKSQRLERMSQVAPALMAIANKLTQIEEAMGQMLPDVIKEQPLGVAVDLISDIKMAIDILHGDGASVVTNRVKSRLNYVREVTLPNRFDDEKVKTFNTERFRVTRTVSIRASILGETKDEAFEWLRNNELGDLIKPTVNASSLSAAAKEQIENGQELPEELFRVHYQDGCSITKLKPKRG